MELPNFEEAYKRYETEKQKAIKEKKRVQSLRWRKLKSRKKLVEVNWKKAMEEKSRADHLFTSWTKLRRRLRSYPLEN
ncbi:uncharacterized protein Pyn_27972 [Prunus yedoensis var. nudiflora]|uniref:Uncharacterized protein n=1 Tax=Prunus yedoensis var. nudiflora TaxID=2094558 RepID=A0A314UXD7_PRUYE|nr:uncharacterized protein Pyn_27972 [Prunus yedoensis var. nudiflora]